MVSTALDAVEAEYLTLDEKVPPRRQDRDVKAMTKLVEHLLVHMEEDEALDVISERARWAAGHEGKKNDYWRSLVSSGKAFENGFERIGSAMAKDAAYDGDVPEGGYIDPEPVIARALRAAPTADATDGWTSEEWADWVLDWAPRQRDCPAGVDSDVFEALCSARGVETLASRRAASA